MNEPKALAPKPDRAPFLALAKRRFCLASLLAH
jgi:hypothetical protein